MYTPAAFIETNRTLLIELIEKNPLGILFTAGSSGLMVTPIPFLYRVQNEQPTLIAHLAKANKHWRDLMTLNECLVIFQGEENYVTPSWYAEKQTTHKVVPTWNYEIVEVHGVPKIIQSIDWLQNQINELTNSMEQKRNVPWVVANAPADYINREVRAIVGLEIKITSINGKWKMSQNKSLADAEGVVAGLSNPNDPHFNLALANSVSNRIIKK